MLYLQGSGPKPANGASSTETLEEPLNFVFKGTQRFLKADGYSIHSVDYPLRGPGSLKRLKHLNYVERFLCGVTETTETELSAMSQDIDAMEMPAFNYAYSFNNSPSSQKPVWQRWGALNLCGKFQSNEKNSNRGNLL